MIVFGASVFALVGCQSKPKPNADQPAPVVTVFAAASTTDAVDEIRKQFAASQPVQMRTNFAGSSTLAQQIAAGAEADVFISANPKWADFLGDKDLIARRENLLGNQLTIIVPADNPANISKAEDLLQSAVEHVALADPDAVPAGIYARQTLTRLKLWDGVEHKVVRGADVRQALLYVERGEAEAGIVYATDAAISSKVRVAVKLDPKLSDPIRYPVVLLRHGAKNPAAMRFYQFLSGSAAAKTFRKYGFTVLVPASTEDSTAP